MRLDIDAIKVLELVVEQGSFAKAADKLHRAQSAVSYQIKKLEQQLGVALFDRSQYRAELTPEGKAILTEGKKLLQQANNLQVLADRFSEGWEPRLEIVIDGALPMEPVMQALKKMSDLDIPTRIQLKTEFLSGVQQRFERDGSDLMLVKELQSNPYLNVKPLPDITFVLLASPEHPLAQARQLELRHLHEHVELTIQDSGEVDKSHQDDLQFGGDRVFYLSGFISKKKALLMGLGYGWMPAYQIKDDIEQGRLVELDYLGGSRFVFTPQLVHSSVRPLGRAGRLFSDFIVKEFNRQQY